MSAVLAGASGLVGGHVARLAAADTVALVRREMAGLRLPQRVVDFGALDLGELRVERVYCALGTTIRKAGSQAAFRLVDFDYPMALARAARAAGATDFRLVSSVGADARSSNFYLRVKGELEEALAGLGFASLMIFRPAVLLGDRGESRPGEMVGKALSVAVGPLLLGPLAKYRATRAEDVARAMVTWPAGAGVRVFHQPDLVS